MEEKEKEDNTKHNENKYEKKKEKEKKNENEDKKENKNENKNENEDKNENENKNNNKNIDNNNNDNNNENANKDENDNINKNENENTPEKKEESETINYIPEFIKSNRLKISKKKKNSLSTKRLNRNPIKAKGDLIKRSDSKENQDFPQLNYTYRNDHNLNMLYLYPNKQEEKIFENATINTKSEKKMIKKESQNSIRDELNKKFSTPYKRINIKLKKLPISSSTNVIIKNFNYNNVYNINIDNDKEKNKNKEKKEKFFINKKIK